MRRTVWVEGMIDGLFVLSGFPAVLCLVVDHSLLWKSQLSDSDHELSILNGE